MKKTILLLGTFTFLLAAPTYAQEESKKEIKQVEAQPERVEKAQLKKGDLKEKKVEKKAVTHRKSGVLKPIEKKSGKSKTTKASVPARIKEKE